VRPHCFARHAAAGGTITPFEGAANPGFYTPRKELVRQAVNHWIRNSEEFNAVIDFDRALRDPSHPSRILPAFDSGDGVHPNDLGMQAMANAISLDLFRIVPHGR
jgi:lysophospholipase L1-like esterase